MLSMPDNHSSHGELVSYLVKLAPYSRVGEADCEAVAKGRLVGTQCMASITANSQTVHPVSPPNQSSLAQHLLSNGLADPSQPLITQH